MKSHECAAVKTCNTCKEEKTLDNFYIARGKPVGRCKSCAKAIRQNLKFTNPEMYKRELDRSNAVKKRLGRDHLKASKDKWDESNVERIRRYNRDHYDPERHRIYRAKNPEAHRTAVKSWQKRNKEQVTKWKRKAGAKRRSMKKNAFVIWADQDAIGKLYAEAVDRENADGVKYHVDHIIPLVHPRVCGLHCEDNLRVITAEDNMLKSNTFD